MKTSTATQLKAKLATIQKRARVRTMDEGEMVYYAEEIHAFLRRSPIGTAVKGGLSARLPARYNGVAEATYVAGRKVEAPTGIVLDVCRDAKGFGKREYNIFELPAGYVAPGPAVHSSGACDNLESASVIALPKED